MLQQQNYALNKIFYIYNMYMKINCHNQCSDSFTDKKIQDFSRTHSIIKSNHFQKAETYPIIIKMWRELRLIKKWQCSATAYVIQKK